MSKTIISAYPFILIFILSSCQSNLVKEYDDNGILSKEYRIDEDSLIQGEYTFYYEDGTSPFEKSFYIDGQLHGTRTLYFQDGQAEIVEQYERDVLIDTLKVYYPSGALKQRKPYDMGVLSGILFTFYEDGTLKEEATFVNNEEQGPFVEYHPSGQPKWRGTYRNGDNEYGELIQYDSTGTMIRKMMCDTAAICTTIWRLEEGYISQ